METLADSERLSFYGIVGGAEVEMLLKSFVVGDENVATGGRAKASSTWGKPYEAEKAFEGFNSSRGRVIKGGVRLSVCLSAALTHVSFPIEIYRERHIFYGPPDTRPEANYAV